MCVCRTVCVLSEILLRYVLFPLQQYSEYFERSFAVDGARALLLRPPPPPPPDAAAARAMPMRYSLAFLPWGVLAPLNVLKLMLNKARAATQLLVLACACACMRAENTRAHTHARARARSTKATQRDARTVSRTHAPTRTRTRHTQVSPTAHFWVPKETEQCQAPRAAPRRAARHSRARSPRTRA